MDDFDLARYVDAQTPCYEQVVRELRSGRKRSHWMWFIFPQFDGLALSSTSRLYAIKSLDEARAYLAHPVLGPRLLECTRAVLDVRRSSAHDIFGSPDDIKFRSCMTLFELVSGDNSLFAVALERCFGGRRDARTLELVGNSD
ncbi:MAG: DUF1810 domain-containing protein [Steroidobacteraceae bacterium]